MAYRYSPSTGGFYRAEQRVVPNDTVAVTAKAHAALLAAQAGGKLIVPDRDGHPIAVYPVPDRARLVAMVKKQATRRIEAVSPLWRQLNDISQPSDDGARRFAQINAIRAASDVIEHVLASTDDASLSAFPIADNPLWPDFEDHA